MRTLAVIMAASLLATTSALAQTPTQNQPPNTPAGYFDPNWLIPGGLAAALGIGIYLLTEQHHHHHQVINQAPPVSP
jgi:hypothetical protein